MPAFTIQMPDCLDFDGSLQFLINTSSLSVSRGHDIVFDFGPVKWAEPFGSLLVASRVRKLVHECTLHGIACFSKGYSDTVQSHTYLAHMGFFQSVGINHGNEPGQARGSDRYVPITEITRDSIVRDPAARFDTALGESVERKSLQLAAVLAQNSANLRETLKYCIREIIRNGLEHSRSEKVWIVGQCWPNKDLVEIAVLDEGVGIKASLSQNPNLFVQTDEDALRWAIRPGISGAAHQVSLRQTRTSYSEWDNSGYGLYVTSQLCELAGDFVLISGKAALCQSTSGARLQPSHYRGTAARIRFTLSKLPKLQEALKKIVDAGERMATSTGVPAIKTASKSSRSASLADEDTPA